MRLGPRFAMGVAMGFTRAQIDGCALPENAFIFEVMSDYLTMIAMLVKAVEEALATSVGVTTLQYRIMSSLLAAGPATGVRLARELDVLPTTLSAAAAKLCDFGLLARGESLADMRVVELSATSACRELVDAANVRICDVMGDYFDSLTAGQFDAVVSAISVVASCNAAERSLGQAQYPAILLANAVLILKAAMAQRLKALCLNARDYRVLLAVEVLGDGCTNAAISRYLFLAPSDVAPCLKNLQALGYVSRKRFEGNRRMRLVALTVSGKEGLQRLTPKVFDALYEVGPCSDEQISELNMAAHDLVTRKRSRSEFG